MINVVGKSNSIVHRISAVATFGLLFVVLFSAAGAEAAGITLRSTFSTSTSSGSHLDFVVPEGTQVGDLLVATFAVQGGSTGIVTAPDGWTRALRTEHGTEIAQSIYYRFHEAGDPSTERWGFRGGQKRAAGMIAYGGIDPANPIAAVLGQTTSGSSSVTAPAVHVAPAGARLIGFFGIAEKTSFTPPSGMTELFDLFGTGGSGPTLMVAEQELTQSGSTGTRVAVSGVSGNGIGQLLALRPAARAPIANAGPDQTVDESAGVALDGSASSDPDGGSLTYAWSQTAGPAVTLSSSAVSRPTFTAPAVSPAGILLTFQLRVTNPSGQQATDTVDVAVRNVNAAPSATDNTYGVSEDTPFTVAAPGVLADDTDPDNDALTARLVQGPTRGTLSLSADGSFTYTPAANFHGVDSFAYEAFDGVRASNTATVELTIASVDDAPVASDDAYTGAEDALLSVPAGTGVLANDNDVDGDALTAVLTTGPTHGALTLNADGSFAYQPNANHHGSDAFTYRAQAGEAFSAPANVRITVTPANDAPVAMNDAVTLPEDAGPTLIDVLANDSDVDGEPVSLVSVTTPAHGAATIVDGKVRYTPNANYHGGDAFNYVIRDPSGATASARVTVTVTSVNDAPVLAPIGPKSGLEQSLLTFLVSATDVDGTPTLSAAGLPSGATFDAATGEFRWTPGYEQAGAYTVTFSATDGELADTEAVTITIADKNRAPVLAPIGNHAVDEAQALGFRVSATDPDGATPTLSATGLPSGATFDAATGDFAWTPNHEQSGSYGVTFAASDGTATDSETITITVGNVNRPPILGPIPSQTVAEAGTLSFTATASDPDGDPVRFSAVGLPSGATFDAGTFQWTTTYTDAGTYTVTITASDGAATHTRDVSITVTNVNRAPTLSGVSDRTVAEDQVLSFTVTASDPDGTTPTLTANGLPAGATFQSGTFSWRPSFTQAGVHAVTFTASDGEASASATASLTVTNVNRAPVLAAIGSRSVNEASTLSFTLTAQDPDGDAVTYSMTGLPAAATLDPGTGAFSWTPTHSDAGTYTASFAATDGALSDSEAVNIVVGDVPRPPVLAAIPDQTVAEQSRLTFTVTASDPDGDPITLSNPVAPAGASFDPATGTFAWTPDYSQGRTETYDATFQAASGGQTDTRTVRITVTNVNRVPTLAPIGAKTVAEGSTLQFTVTASDPDGGTPTLGHQGLPSGATFQAGAFSWTPDYSRAAQSPYSVTFTATDADGGVATETITITVTNTNRAPVLAPVGTVTGAENALLVLVLSASDPDGQPLTFSVAPSIPGASLNAATGEFRWTPSYSQAGTYNPTFAVSDGQASHSQPATITIENTNRAPSIAALPDVDAAEGQLVAFSVTATDPDGDAVTLTVASAPAGSAFADGQFSWTPSFDQAGPYDLVFTAKDPHQASASEAATIRVANTNRAPVLAPIGDRALAETETLTITLSASDPDADPLTYSAAPLPQGATLSGASFTWTPDHSQEGTYTTTFTVSDGTATTSETIRIVVGDGNRAPRLAPVGDQAGAENTLLQFFLDGSDPDGDELVYSADALPDGALLDAASGEFAWTPTFDQAGDHRVTFRASDGTDAVTETVTLRIANVNRAPVLDPIGPRHAAEGATVAFALSASDPDGDPLTYTATDLPAGAAFDAATRQFSWTTTFDDAGVHAVTFRASDGDLSDDERVVLTIANVNRAPVLAPVGPIAAAEGARVEIPLSAEDPDGDPLTFTALNLPLGASLASGSGLFVWTPTFTQSGAYTVTFKVSDGAATDSEAVTITVANTNRPPVFAPVEPQTAAEGLPLAFTVTATDPDGPRPTLTAPSLPVGASFDPVTGEFRWTPTFSQAGPHAATFRASDGQASATLNVPIDVANSPVPTQLRIASQPSTVQSGAPFTLVVRIQDEEGNFDPTATRTITLAKATGPADGVLSGALTQLATNGEATFPDLRLDLAGTYTVSAAAIGLAGSVSAPIVVTAGPGHRLEFDQVPSTVASAAAFSLRVRVLDAAGNPASAYAEPVTLRLLDGPADGRLQGTVTRNAQAGVADFTGLLLAPGGRYQLEASSGALPPAASPTITVTQTASTLFLAAAPTQIESGAPFTVAVQVRDAHGDLVADANGRITLTLEETTGGRLTGTRARNAVGGEATFDGLKLDLVGVYKILIQSTGLPDARTPDITVRAGAPFQVQLQGVPEVRTSGETFGATVRVLDAAGNLVPDATNQVFVIIKTGPDEGRLDGEVHRAAANGIATFEGLSLSPAGSYVIGAGSTGLTSQLSLPVRVSVPSGPEAVEEVKVGTPPSSDVFLAGAPDNSGADGKAHVSIRQASVERRPNSLVFRIDLQGSLDTSVPAWYEARFDTDLDGTPDKYLRAAYRPGPDAASTWQACTFTLVGAADAPSASFDPASCATTQDDVASAALGPAPQGAATFVNGLKLQTSLAGEPGLVAFEASRGPLLAWLAAPQDIIDVQFFVLGSLAYTPPVPVPMGSLDVVILTPDGQTPGAATMVAGTSRQFVAVGVASTGEQVSDVVFEWILPSGTEVASADALGRVTAHRPGATELRARIGSVASAPVVITVVPGPLAQLRLLPESAAMSASVPVDFLAQGFDAQGNPVSLAEVEWFVDGAAIATLGPHTTFTFPAGQAPGPHEVTARSGGRTRAGIVSVTSAVARTDAVTAIPAASVTSTVGTVQVSTVVAGVLEAERHSTLNILPPAPTSESSLILSAQVGLERPAQNLAILVETQLGDLSSPPPETNPAELAELLHVLSASGTPGMFLRVSAVEGGQPLPSQQLNDLLGTMHVTVLVPASYFDQHGFDPARIRLIEYSDGRLVTTELFADLSGATPDGLHYAYDVTIDEFSAFAILGAAIKATSPPPRASVIQSGGLQGTVYSVPQTAPSRTISLRTTDARIIRADFLVPGRSDGITSFRAFEALPAGLPTVPTGITVNRYFEMHMEANVEVATVHVSLPASEVPDPARALLLHHVDGVWRPEGRFNLERSGDRYVGSATTTCCSFFAVAFDRISPQLAIAVPSTVATGLVRVPANVKDNLEVKYVEFYVDNELVFTDYEAPFELLLNTARYENGTHEIRAIAYDFAGNLAEMAADATFRNARVDRTPAKTTIVEGTEPGSNLILSLLAPIGLAILLAAGVAFAMGRTRRSGERALRDLLSKNARAQDPDALTASELGFKALFSQPSRRGNEEADDATDNPLVPADWLR